MYAIIEKETGKELYYKADNNVIEGEIAIVELRTEDMRNPYFDFESRKYYDLNVLENNLEVDEPTAEELVAQKEAELLALYAELKALKGE